MKKILVVLLSLVGLANALPTNNSVRLNSISQINESSQLLLEHSKDFQLKNNDMGSVTNHYSHASHASHASHSSHYSSRY